MTPCMNKNATWMKHVDSIQPLEKQERLSEAFVHHPPHGVSCPVRYSFWFMKDSPGSRGLGGKKKEKDEFKRSGKTRVRDAYHYEARLGDSQRSHVLLLSPLDDLAPLCLRWEKGNGRRIYCWVLTCTHSWCCFSPLGPLAIPKASKTTGCQVVTAGFKQLLQQPCT